MYVCVCKGITEEAVRGLVASGVVTLDGLIDALALDDPACCGRCLEGARACAAGVVPEGCRRARLVSLVAGLVDLPSVMEEASPASAR